MFPSRMRKASQEYRHLVIKGGFFHTYKQIDNPAALLANLIGTSDTFYGQGCVLKSITPALFNSGIVV